MGTKLATALEVLRQVILAADVYIETTTTSSKVATVDFYHNLQEVIFGISTALEPVVEICKAECWENEAHRAAHYIKVCENAINLVKQMVISDTNEAQDEEALSEMVAVEYNMRRFTFEYHERKKCSGTVDPDPKQAAAFGEVMAALEKLFAILEGKLVHVWLGEQH